MGWTIDHPSSHPSTVDDQVESSEDFGLALDAAQAEDRAYYQKRLALMRAARLRAGLTVAVLYALLLAAAYTAFGIWTVAQQDRYLRGLLGFAMYVFGFCSVPLTLAAVRLYHRLWRHHARRLGLDTLETTEASPQATAASPDGSLPE
jgi:hypothetical protein